MSVTFFYFRKKSPMESQFWRSFPQFRPPPLLHSGTNLVLSFSSLFVSVSLSSHLQSSLKLYLWQKFCSSRFVPRLECFLRRFLEVPVWREMWCFLARRPLTLVLHSGTCRHFSTLVAFLDTPLLCLSVSFSSLFGHFFSFPTFFCLYLRVFLLLMQNVPPITTFSNPLSKHFCAISAKFNQKLIMGIP